MFVNVTFRTAPVAKTRTVMATASRLLASYSRLGTSRASITLSWTWPSSDTPRENVSSIRPRPLTGRTTFREISKCLALQTMIPYPSVARAACSMVLLTIRTGSFTVPLRVSTMPACIGPAIALSSTRTAPAANPSLTAAKMRIRSVIRSCRPSRRQPVTTGPLV